MSSNADRLAEAVKARREELDLTQMDVWQAGGPSNTTQTRIENGELETLTRVTARKIDAGLQWAPGSAKAVFEHGSAPRVAEHGLSLRDLTWVREQIGRADIDEDDRERLLRALDEGRGSA